MEDQMEKKEYKPRTAQEKNLSLNHEKLILVGIWDDPQEGILLVQCPTGQLELPGGSIFKNFDLRTLIGQQYHEIGSLQKLINEKSGLLIKVKSLIAVFHYPRKNKVFKAFLLELAKTNGLNPDCQKKSGFKIFFIQKKDIPAHSKIKYADQQILLDYIKRERQIKHESRIDSPFTSIITID